MLSGPVGPAAGVTPALTPRRRGSDTTNRAVPAGESPAIYGLSLLLPQAAAMACTPLLVPADVAPTGVAGPLSPGGAAVATAAVAAGPLLPGGTAADTAAPYAGAASPAIAWNGVHSSLSKCRNTVTASLLHGVLHNQQHPSMQSRPNPTMLQLNPAQRCLSRATLAARIHRQLTVAEVSARPSSIVEVSCMQGCMQGPPAM
jgi:hypothetical protein